MRIVLATIGSDGDLQPFYAFARRLLGDGHDVTLAANERYAARARALGVPFVSLAPAWEEAVMRPRVEKIIVEPAPLRQLAARQIKASRPFSGKAPSAKERPLHGRFRRLETSGVVMTRIVHVRADGECYEVM